MKKAKKIVLLFFMHAKIREASRGNGISYQELYESIPLSESTIRGIVQEFLQDHLLRKSSAQVSSHWILTESGYRAGSLLFPSLIASQSPETVMLIVLPQYTLSQQKKANQILTEAQAIRLDTRTFMLFGERANGVARRFRSTLAAVPLTILHSDANKKGISDFLFATSLGKKAYQTREKLLSVCTLHNRRIAPYSPNSTNQRKMRLKVFADIISAFEHNTVIPEQYYLNEMRLSKMIDIFW